MPVEQKHPIDEPLPEAPREFTDREEFVAAFENSISDLPLQNNRVLVYHGVGGIGKSRLQERLAQELEERHSHIAWARLDFETPAYRDVEGGLFRLREILREKYRVQFRLFDVAYAEFWQKNNPQIPLRKENLPWLEEGEFLTDLLALTEDIPGLGLVGKMPRLAGKAYGSVREWWTKRDQQALGRLQGMEPHEIAKHLPVFWALDLRSYMQRKSQPIVLFIDAYEALCSSGEQTVGKFYSRDEWVQKLAEQLPEVLWVVSGREKLRWEERAPAWAGEDRLKQHLVGELADDNVRSFLTSCGITDEAIQQVIVEGSKGVPFYLDVSVDNYLSMQKQEKTLSPSDFGQTPRKVVDRFVSHLKDYERETLKVLSVPRFWDYELFGSLVREFNTGYPVTRLPELRRYSFVQEGRVPGNWTIHEKMREGLEEHLDPELRTKTHKFLFDHYNRQLEDLEIKAIDDSRNTAFAEAFHHGQHALDTEQFFEWFKTIGQSFFQAGLWWSLTTPYEQFTSLIAARLGSEHQHTGSAMNGLAVLYQVQGRYREAEPLYQRALAIRERLQDNPATARTFNDLAALYRDQKRYEEAEPLCDKALELRKRLLGEDNPDTARTLNNLAAIYRGQKRYEEAETLCDKALAIYKMVLGGEENPDTARTLNNLAAIYRGQKRYEEAETLFEKVLSIRERVLGEEHQDTARTLNDFACLYRDQACLYRDQRCYREAEALYQRALAIYERVHGVEHPDTAQTLNNLANLYWDQGRYDAD